VGKRHSAITWRRMIVVNLVISIVSTVFLWSFRPEVPWIGVLWTFGFCLAFTNLFGTPSAFILARLGPRIDGLAPPWKWLLMAIQIVGFTLVGIALGIFAMQLLGLANRVDFWRDYVMGLRIGMVIALTVGLGFALWETRREELATARRELHERELAEAHVRRQLAEARLASLESRLHPHFLFNTLNSIAALIPENPRLAEGTVERLAALLRFTLDAAERRLVPFSLESQVVADYLEIEGARFGRRLDFSLSVEEGAHAVLVPPLAVQTLVENSVKHAVSARPDGASIRLCARVIGGDLAITVEDDGPGFPSRDLPEGHGLSNLQERLCGLFGDRAHLEVGASESGGARVQLLIPVEGIEA
jgi:signal transduction histidine kinase